MSNSIKKDMSGYRQYRYYKKIRCKGFGAYKTVPYTRKRSIEYYCRECVSFSYEEMKNCTMPECHLFPYRLGRLPEGKTAKGRAKAIRSHCMDCTSGDREYIANCPSSLCPTHPFRLSGYQTDKSSLIPAEDIENSSAHDREFVKIEEKIAV